MAGSAAIAATSEAIRRLLESARSDSGEFASISIEHSTVADLRAPGEEGLSLILYRVRVASMDRSFIPRNVSGPWIPLELHYVVAARAPDRLKAQRLLGWAIRVLSQSPVLSSALLTGTASAEGVFGPQESVELIWEPLTGHELSEIWLTAGMAEPLSASYVARPVTIDAP